MRFKLIVSPMRMNLPEAEITYHAKFEDALDQACTCLAMGDAMPFVRIETEDGSGIEGADLEPYCRGRKNLHDFLRAKDRTR
ncbi:MAG TPA: hypothetical protein VNH44_04470 [Micropepsaceae bacterium]|nr:hypothetical protein [Micropepsaceae bacterium]